MVIDRYVVLDVGFVRSGFLPFDVDALNTSGVTLRGVHNTLLLRELGLRI
jgi:hypothetical protein